MVYNNDKSRYALVWKTLNEDISINYYKLKFDAPELLENIYGAGANNSGFSGSQPGENAQTENSNPYLAPEPAQANNDSQN